MYALGIVVKCQHLDWQVSSMAQISNSLGQIFSTVERLSLQYRAHSESSEEHNEVDRIEWRKLLRPFSNVKTLRIEEWARQGSLSLSGIGGWRALFRGVTRAAGAQMLWEQTILVMHLLHSSMLARTQVDP
jgi:hypothetical protein